MKLKDLDALGLTKARAEIIVRAADGVNTISPFGVPVETLRAIVRAGFAEWVREADAATQKALAQMRDEYVAGARVDLLKEPPDWKHALALLHGADAHERDGARTVLRLTDKGVAFAKAWKERGAR